MGIVEECAERACKCYRQAASVPNCIVVCTHSQAKAGVREGMRWIMHRVPLELVCMVCKSGLTGCLGDKCSCGNQMVPEDVELRALAGPEETKK